MNYKKLTVKVLSAFAFFVLLSPVSRAQTYAEVGDAGSTPGGAQASGLSQGGAAVFITGTITGANDADVFRIQVNSPGSFFATTINAITQASGLDTQLFLFDALGRPVYANDDANGLSLQSTLPAGSIFLNGLTPGLYYLAISLSGNDPVNLSNQLVFQMAAASTDVRGPAGPLNPASFSDFNNGNSFAQTGAYQITIVPEPSTYALIVLAAFAAGFITFQRRLRA